MPVGVEKVHKDNIYKAQFATLSFTPMHISSTQIEEILMM